jgi:hypothetical protein
MVNLDAASDLDIFVLKEVMPLYSARPGAWVIKSSASKVKVQCFILMAKEADSGR